MSKYKFDITVTDNTYAGEPDGFYSAAVESLTSVNNGGLTVMEGFSHKLVLNGINGDGGEVQAAGCDFNDGASLSLTEQVLTLTDLRVNEDICIPTLIPLWSTYARQASRNDQPEPTFVDYALGHLAAKVGESIERGIWRGTSPYGVGFLTDDGTLDETGADASILAGFTENDLADVLGVTTSAGTSLAVSDALNDVLDTAMGINGGALADQPGAGFYVNRKTYHFLGKYLTSVGSGQGINNLSANQDVRSGLSWLGYPVYMCPGMFDDTIVFSYPANMIFGTSAGADYNSLNIIDLRETTGDDKLRVTGRFQCGVQVANPNDGVYATTVWT